MLMKELADHLERGEITERHLIDLRRGKNTPFPFAHPLLQSVYKRLARRKNVNEAERGARIGPSD